MLFTVIGTIAIVVGAVLSPPGIEIWKVVFNRTLSIIAVWLVAILGMRQFKTENDLDRFYSTSQDLLCIAGFDGYFKELNDVWETSLGYTKEELFSKSVFEFVHPEDRERSKSELESLDKGNKTFSFENRYVAKDGSIKSLLWNAIPIIDEQIVYGVGRDITPLKKAQKRDSLLAAIIQSAEDSYVGMDLKGNIISWNPGAQKMFGYTDSEIIGKSADIIFPTDRKIEFTEKLEKIKKGLSIETHDTIRKTKSGEIIDVAVSASPIKDMGGNIIGIAVVDRNITGQKRQFAYARNLIESSLDPLVTISPEGKITDVNEATTQVTGSSREQLIGSDFSNYFTEPEKAQEGYRQVFSKGRVTDYPLTLKSSTEKLTDVLYNASVYKNERGDVLGVFAAARDITAQKQASQYARSLIESSLDPLVTISLAGKITDVNEATVKVTGVSKESLIGTDFSNYFTEPGKAREGYQEVFKKGFVTDYALTIKSSTGNLTDVLYNASVYKDAKGNTLGVFAAARDVTERNKAEGESKQKTERLQKFQNLTVGRELEMMKLKKEINELSQKLGEGVKYPEVSTS